MNVSDQGLALLREREGCRLAAYLDTVGVPTIGVGHTGGVKLGDTCTLEQATAVLREDIALAEAAIRQNVRVPLRQHEFDALGSFIFNVGVRAFTTSTLLKKLNAGDYAGAALQFDRWHIPPEITSRRNGEREQFRGSAFRARL
jgi:lysozyme